MTVLSNSKKLMTLVLTLSLVLSMISIPNTVFAAAITSTEHFVSGRIETVNENTGIRRLVFSVQAPGNTSGVTIAFSFDSTLVTPVHHITHTPSGSPADMFTLGSAIPASAMPVTQWDNTNVPGRTVAMKAFALMPFPTPTIDISGSMTDVFSFYFQLNNLSDISTDTFYIVNRQLPPYTNVTGLIPSGVLINTAGSPNSGLPWAWGHQNVNHYNTISSGNIGIDIPLAAPSIVAVELSTSSSYTFPSRMLDYTNSPSHQVIITNTGTTETGNITINILGSDPTSFIVDPGIIPSIPVSQISSFNVSPVLGLDEGNYSATIVVLLESGQEHFFDVSFAVSAGTGDLNLAIQLAETKVQYNYTDLSWAILQSQLNTARNVRDNENATQSQIDNALISLNAAISSLEELPAPPIIDRSALEIAISNAETREQANYTPLSWAILQSQLNTANYVNNNIDATQSQIDNATSSLEEAIISLVLL